MDKPLIPQTSPIVVEVKAGEVYWWCTCGRSKAQPFCDGSHEGTSFSPSKFEAEVDKRISFCACKYSEKKPFCDGAHKALREKAIGA